MTMLFRMMPFVPDSRLVQSGKSGIWFMFFFPFYLMRLCDNINSIPWFE